MLQDAGGWPERDTAERFAEYAVAVYERLHDRVTHWTTLNEPWCSAFIGYASGRHAPGIQDGEAALRAAHHLMLGHGLATTAMRAQGDADSVFGITLNLHPGRSRPATTPPTSTRRAGSTGSPTASSSTRCCAGATRPTCSRTCESVTDGSHIQDGDLETIHVPLDFLGINYYYRTDRAGGRAATTTRSRRRGPARATSSRS